MQSEFIGGSTDTSGVRISSVTLLSELIGGSIDTSGVKISSVTLTAV